MYDFRNGRTVFRVTKHREKRVLTYIYLQKVLIIFRIKKDVLKTVMRFSIPKCSCFFKNKHDLSFCETYRSEKTQPVTFRFKLLMKIYKKNIGRKKFSGFENILGYFVSRWSNSEKTQQFRTIYV